MILERLKSLSVLVNLLNCRYYLFIYLYLQHYRSMHGSTTVKFCYTYIKVLYLYISCLYITSYSNKIS